MPNYRQAQRIDSAQRWEEVNPILEDGELGIARFYDEDGKVIKTMAKCGDGIRGADGTVTGTRWNDLPWLTGQQGEKGDVGPRPEHNWKGTSLRFQNADSTWGEYVDLKGEPGNRVNAEPATTTTLGGVMPATGLRVDIEGHEYVALGWDAHACYSDPIVVIHENSVWMWLKESGVGTEAGVREPGKDASTAYWQSIALVTDLPGAGLGLEYDPKSNQFSVKYGNTPGTALEGDGKALTAGTADYATAAGRADSAGYADVAGSATSGTAHQLVNARRITVNLGNYVSYPVWMHKPTEWHTAYGGSDYFDGSRDVTINIPYHDAIDCNCDCNCWG